MKNERTGKWRPAVPGFIAFILLMSILLFPEEAYHAALSGLNIFMRSVFPALLPFFIASDIMTGLGVVDFFSVLLNPVMGPIFRCPGSSSFIWIMSITSGYPTGARLTAMFRRKDKITPEEAQRILSFCSTSGPLFMMGAVAIGMMGTVEGGTVILISHYSASILMGLIFRFYRSGDYKPSSSRASIRKALDELSRARNEDGRTIGEIMGNAVTNSVNVLLMVGGFIILFSVVIDLLMRLRIIDWISSAAALPFRAFIRDDALIKAIIGGMFEVTTGGKLVSETGVSMQLKIAAASFLIGWSGLSIHAQTASILTGTGVRIGLYMAGKFLHGVLAALISLPLTKLLYPEALETSSPVIPVAALSWKEVFLYSSRLLVLSLLTLALISLLAYPGFIFKKNKKAVAR